MGQMAESGCKNVYRACRENLELSREKASEIIGSIPPERLERIENEKSFPHPDEVLAMAEGYKAPDLCNYFCSNQCPIGNQYVPQIKIKDLSQIVLETIASLNSVSKAKDRLIEIAADGIISEDEMPDFIGIQEDLEHISIAVETLQLWAERMLSNGKIDVEAYNACKSKMKK